MTDSTDRFSFVTYPDNATYTRTAPGQARCVKRPDGKHMWGTHFHGDGYTTYKCIWCGAKKQIHTME